MIKRLAACIRQYKKETILTPLFMVGEVACECVIPFLTSALIDQIEGGCGVGTIARYGAFLLLMAMLSLLCGVLSARYAATASAGFAKNLRHDLYYRVQDFSFANIDRFSTASLVTRLTTDVANVQQSFMMAIRVAVRAPLMLIVAAIMSVRLGKKLALIFAVIIPLLGFGLFLLARRAMPLFKAVFKKYDRINASIQENVQGIRVVKSFVREDYEKKKFRAAAEDVCRDFTHAERILGLNAPMMEFSIYSSRILISYFAAKLIVTTSQRYIALGALSGMITYSMQILSSLMMLSMVFVMITMSAESARRIYEVLDEGSTIESPKNPVKTVKDGAIDFENVSFRYSEKAEKMALRDVNLHIRSGQTVGILGGTGSSKSTLVQLIPRLYDVSEGAVRVGGVDVRDYDLEVLREEVSMVLQKNVLFSGTVKENLRWGDPDASDEELERICRLAQADEFISQMPKGYDTYIERGGTNVSGGQKQRLCIARALLKKPKILILDDSTSAVDTQTDAKIRHALRTEIPDTTKIIIAQRVSSVQEADWILVMENGEIVAQGDHEALLKTSEIYREVYESQNAGGGTDEAE